MYMTVDNLFTIIPVAALFIGLVIILFKRKK